MRWCLWVKCRVAHSSQGQNICPIGPRGYLALFSEELVIMLSNTVKQEAKGSRITHKVGPNARSSCSLFELLGYYCLLSVALVMWSHV